MKTQTKQKTVKPEAENRSIFGRIKGILKIKTKTREEAISHTRGYHQTEEQQIRKMFKLHKDNPNLSYCDIAKAVNVSEAVCRYWLKQNERDVIALFKIKKGRKITEKIKSTESKTEMKLSTFSQLSNIEGERLLDKLKSEERHPIHHLADPKIWEGALPSQVVATEEEWKEEDRNYKIGKATMHKAIVAKGESEKEEKRKDRLHIEH